MGYVSTSTTMMARLLLLLLLVPNETTRGIATDKTVASRFAASKQLLLVNHLFDEIPGDTDMEVLRQFFAREEFTPTLIAHRLQIPGDKRHSCCPLYVSAAAAGAVRELPVLDTVLDCLTALFLVGLVLPRSVLQNMLDDDVLDILFKLGILVADDDLEEHAFSTVSLFPLQVRDNECVWIFTDWHPRVLPTTHFGAEDGTVMYLGPDSIALVEHWTKGVLASSEQNTLRTRRTWLDLCTGSGVQAIVAMKLGLCDACVCVDINQRALRFCHFNMKLNGLLCQGRQLFLVKGDLLLQKGTIYPSFAGMSTASIEEPLVPLLRNLLSPRSDYDIVTSNPPFLPVPPVLSRRHGLFSNGGPSGADLLHASIDLAEQVLDKESGFAAIVSEFFFPNPVLWRDSRAGSSLLFTNESPLSVEEYARRRASNEEEFHLWHTHLKSGQGIDECSPGLLYLSSGESGAHRHFLVPLSLKYGSVWTPGNIEAVEFTSHTTRVLFFNETKLRAQKSFGWIDD